MCLVRQAGLAHVLGFRHYCPWLSDGSNIGLPRFEVPRSSPDSTLFSTTPKKVLFLRLTRYQYVLKFLQCIQNDCVHGLSKPDIRAQLMLSGLIGRPEIQGISTFLKLLG